MKNNTNFNWRKILALALAAVMLISTIALFLSILAGCQKNDPADDPNKIEKPGYTALKKITYPEVYAFDNIDKRLEVIENYPVEKPFLKAVDDFSYRSAAALLAANEQGENFNFSPLSLYLALALATSGAGPDSATQMELLDLLGASEALATSSQSASTADLLSTQSKNLYHQLFLKNEIGQLNIANSLWMDDEVNGQKIDFQDKFIENAAQNFFASVYSVDFSDQEKTGAAMAEWVSEHTNGKIEPTFNFDSLQVLSILNTIYFYDQWDRRFDEKTTAPDIFYLSDGNEVEVDFMNQTQSSASFARGENYTRAARPLKNGGEMIFILPDKGVNLYSLVDSAEKMEAAFTGGSQSNGEVVWKMPKFSYDTKLELKEVLQKLGVSAAFTGDADFSNLSEETQIFISNIKQDTFIAVNENGVEAAAFTQIDFDTTSMPTGRAEMILDRPFIFGITAPNGSPLFIGLCENPA